MVAPFGGIGLSEHHQAGIQIPLDDPGRLRRDVRAQRSGPHGLRSAGQRRAEILEQERDPGKRTCASIAQHPRVIELAGLLAATVEEFRHDGVQLPCRLESGDGGVEEVDGGQVTSRDEVRLSECVDGCEFASMKGVHGLGA